MGGAREKQKRVETPGRELLQRRLRQLYRAIGIGESARCTVLSIHRTKRQGRKVDVRAPARYLIIDHDPTGTSEQMGSSDASRSRR